MQTDLELLTEHGCHGGVQRFYRHHSAAIGLPMRFSVFLPKEALGTGTTRVPALFYLAGLTCTEETFPIKADAQRHAAEHGMMLISPDTSPRGANAPGEADSWDFGVGAGFYVDAVEAPWHMHWHMESYVASELFAIATTELPGDAARVGIFGHSMGGHGALVLAQRYPHRFRSVSAFAPIAAPMKCPWGVKAFSGYLGNDPVRWAEHDASELMTGQDAPPFPAGILIDQGLADRFLAEQLHPEAFEAACKVAGQPLTLRRHAGYDHGYYFIQTFIADHIRHHAAQL